MGKSHEYDPETNRHDMVSRRESIAVEWSSYQTEIQLLIRLSFFHQIATRLFTAFIFLPSLVGYFVYAFYYGPYGGFWYVPMAIYDFFWYFGGYSLTKD